MRDRDLPATPGSDAGRNPHVDQGVAEPVGVISRSPSRAAACGIEDSSALALMQSEVWPADRNIRIERPFAFARTCCFELVPPFVRPIKRPRPLLNRQAQRSPIGLDVGRVITIPVSCAWGRAIAAELALEGVKVVIAARDATRAERVAQEIGCLALSGDTSRSGAGRTLIAQAADILGKMPDILVTNTGGPPTGSFEATTVAAWSTGFQSLWISTVNCVHAALPSTKGNHWGRILAVTSIAAKGPQPGLVISNGLRAGLLGMLNTLSREVAADGITVNALMPGYTNTDRMADLGVDNATMGLKIPAGRLGEPAEFATLAAFLASP